MKNNKIYVAAWKYRPDYGFSCIWHYDVKEQKHGVRRYQNPDGTWTELGKERRRLAYQKQKRIIKRTDAGHSGLKPWGTPNSIVDHQREDGKIDKRAFYDENGMKAQEIHTTPHGNNKKHSYGLHGEHIHDYVWDKDGRPLENKTRELTKTERRKNGDIL